MVMMMMVTVEIHACDLVAELSGQIRYVCPGTSSWYLGIYLAEAGRGSKPEDAVAAAAFTDTFPKIK